MFPAATSSMYRRHASESDSHGNGLDEFEGTLMKSSILKRSVVIGGHKTSVSLEEPFWIDLKQIARTHHVTLSALITQIDATRDEQSNLSSGIRVFVLRHFRSENERVDVAKDRLFTVLLKEHERPGDPGRIRGVDLRQPSKLSRYIRSSGPD
jgi:predicted DNA-binding ribbon-helix-helix protein